MYMLTLLLFIIFFIIIFPIFLKFIFTYQRANSFETFELLLQATMSQYYKFFFIIQYIIYLLFLYQICF